MKSCIVTGVFDPITLGHIDIIKRALSLFDKVYVVAMVNCEKHEDIDVEHKLSLMKKALSEYNNVIVDYYDGYAIDYCKKNNIKYIVRGIRNCTDYEYESKMAEYNYKNGKVETLFFIADQLKNVSSTLARNAHKKEELIELLPKEIIDDYLKYRIKD